ncbi:MAG: hypothetical protein ACLUVM_03425 [Blautia faecis]
MDFPWRPENMLRNSRAKLDQEKSGYGGSQQPVKVEGAGFQGDTNVLTLITQDEEASLPLMSKEDAAVKDPDKILLAAQRQSIATEPVREPALTTKSGTKDHRFPSPYCIRA